MKNAGTTRVTHNPGDPPIPTDSDWVAVDAMSAAEIDQAALSDADAQPLSIQGSEDFKSDARHLHSRITELETLLAASEARRRSMENSASWKLTAPMRKIRDAIFE